MKILLAEDDGFTRKGLIDIFEDEGYEVIAAEDGEQAMRLFKEMEPELVVLDIMMPKKNGYDVCRGIRKMDAAVPVIFLSAKTEEIDKVLGLELGADDYISKPFGVREVIARIRAVTRRALSRSASDHEGSADDPGLDGNRNDSFLIGGWKVVPNELKALRGEEEIELSIRDVAILQLFALNKGIVLDRDTIYNAGWGYSHMPNSRTLDQHISQLRKKIESDPKHPEIITTVHSVGYKYP